MPVINEYQSRNKVKTVSLPAFLAVHLHDRLFQIESSKGIEEIYQDTIEIIDQVFNSSSVIAN
jgi:hypothetical protein